MKLLIPSHPPLPCRASPPQRGRSSDFGLAALLPLDGGGAERSEAEGVVWYVSPHPALRATLPIEGRERQSPMSGIAV
jgi:hypothetical protein